MARVSGPDLSEMESASTATAATADDGAGGGGGDGGQISATAGPPRRIDRAQHSAVKRDDLEPTVINCTARQRRGRAELAARRNRRADDGDAP